jgi:excisionase family DNA binding protein
MHQLNPERLLSRKEAAELLGIHEMTLAVWQSTKRYQIPIVKVGRLAKYRYADLMQFIESRTINKPAEKAGHE